MVSWFNFDPDKCKKESSDKPSLTVPDMTLDVKELVSRYIRGQEVDTFNPVYLGEDEEFVDIEKLDEPDRLEYLQSLGKDIVRLQKRVAEEQAADKASPDAGDESDESGAEEAIVLESESEDSVE